MAKTVKIGNEYYSEGVRVPAPKKPMAKKKTQVKKNIRSDKDALSKAWSNAKSRQKKWSTK